MNSAKWTWAAIAIFACSLCGILVVYQFGMLFSGGGLRRWNLCRRRRAAACCIFFSAKIRTANTVWDSPKGSERQMLLEFLSQNLANILVGAAVFGVLSAVVVKMIRDRKKHGSCGCGCDHCRARHVPQGLTKRGTRIIKKQAGGLQMKLTLRRRAI
jgi:hypothetical protein